MKWSLRVVTEKKICDHNSEGLTEGQSKPKGQQIFMVPWSIG